MTFSQDQVDCTQLGILVLKVVADNKHVEPYQAQHGYRSKILKQNV